MRSAVFSKGVRAVVGHIASLWVLLAMLRWLLEHLGAVSPVPWWSWTVMGPFVVTALGALVTAPVVLSRFVPGGMPVRPVLTLVVVGVTGVLQTAVTGYPFLYPRLVVAAGVETLHHAPGPRGVRAYVLVVFVGAGLCLALAYAGLTPHALPFSVDAALSVGVATTATYVAMTVARAANAVEHSRRQLLAAEQRRVEDLSHAARHDPLTGVLNRWGLQQRLAAPSLEAEGDSQPSNTTDSKVEFAKARGTGTGIVYIDLDGFKPVNDAHGHGAGDAVLLVVARRLGAVLRASDTVARVGGDEFVVVISPCADQAEVDEVALRIRRSLEQPVEAGAGVIEIGASCGTAWGGGMVHSLDADTLIAAADADMFLKKATRTPRSQRPTGR